MTTIEQASERFFKHFKTICRDDWHFQVFAMANEYKISQNHFEQLLLDWADNEHKLIDLVITVRTHKGWVEKHWYDFNPPNAFFRASRENNYHVTAILLPAGKHYVELLTTPTPEEPKKSFGFPAN